MGIKLSGNTCFLSLWMLSSLSFAAAWVPIKRPKVIEVQESTVIALTSYETILNLDENSHEIRGKLQFTWTGNLTVSLPDHKKRHLECNRVRPLFKGSELCHIKVKESYYGNTIVFNITNGVRLTDNIFEESLIKHYFVILKSYLRQVSLSIDDLEEVSRVLTVLSPPNLLVVPNESNCPVNVYEEYSCSDTPKHTRYTFTKPDGCEADISLSFVKLEEDPFTNKGPEFSLTIINPNRAMGNKHVRKLLDSASFIPKYLQMPLPQYVYLQAMTFSDSDRLYKQTQEVTSLLSILKLKRDFERRKLLVNFQLPSSVVTSEIASSKYRFLRDHDELRGDDHLFDTKLVVKALHAYRQNSELTAQEKDIGRYDERHHLHYSDICPILNLETYAVPDIRDTEQITIGFTVYFQTVADNVTSVPFVCQYENCTFENVKLDDKKTNITWDPNSSKMIFTPPIGQSGDHALSFMLIATYLTGETPQSSGDINGKQVFIPSVQVGSACPHKIFDIYFVLPHKYVAIPESPKHWIRYLRGPTDNKVAQAVEYSLKTRHFQDLGGFRIVKSIQKIAAGVMTADIYRLGKRTFSGQSNVGQLIMDPNESLRSDVDSLHAVAGVVKDVFERFNKLGSIAKSNFASTNIPIFVNNECDNDKHAGSSFAELCYSADIQEDTLLALNRKKLTEFLLGSMSINAVGTFSNM